MKKTYSQRSWQIEMSEAPSADARRELIRKLNKGEIEVTDDSGQPISFTPPPSQLGPSPSPLSSQRDSDTPAPKVDAVPVTKSFSLNDRVAFEDCIADMTELKKFEMRMWFDAKRREEGIK